MRKIEIRENVLIAPYTTFQIGGIARYFSTVKTEEDLLETFAFCKEKALPFLILGKGSNVLFSDKGFDGMVILNKISHLKIEGERVEVGSGYSFALLGVKTASLGLSGLEFASGIPATVGGAIYMNAGASSEQTFDTLESVDFIDFEEGKLFSFTKRELSFGYRFSSFQERKGAITKAVFSLKKKEGAKEVQKGILDYRLSTQPYASKTAGCFFRNPEEMSAGAVIDSLGLKGLTVGGARISTVHANFIENFNNASAEDVLKLVEMIQNIVYKFKGIKLEIEVRIFGAS